MDKLMNMNSSIVYRNVGVGHFRLDDGDALATGKTISQLNHGEWVAL